MPQFSGNPANYPLNYTIPADNTQRSALSVNVAFQALGDRTAYLKANCVDGVNGGTYSGPLTFTNVLGIQGSAGISITGDIECDGFQASSVACALYQMPDGGAGIGHEFSTTFFRVNTDMQFKTTGRITCASPRTLTAVLQSQLYSGNQSLTPFQANWSHVSGSLMVNNFVGTRCWAALPSLPRTLVIQNIRAYVRGATGHVALPATRLAMQFVQVNKTTGTSVVLFANTQDPSASTAAYEVYHNFIISGSHTYTPNTHRYYVEFTAESGANALVGAEIYMVEIIGSYNVIGE